MFEKIKKWYAAGLWTKEMVQKALEKGYVTQEQWGIISGK